MKTGIFETKHSKHIFSYQPVGACNAGDVISSGAIKFQGVVGHEVVVSVDKSVKGGRTTGYSNDVYCVSDDFELEAQSVYWHSVLHS